MYIVYKLFEGIRSATAKNNVALISCNFVQGHHHGVFDIHYLGTPYSLNWGMTVGCLIDDSSLAFAYNKNTLKCPQIAAPFALVNQAERIDLGMLHELVELWKRNRRCAVSIEDVQHFG